jgi:hypothetical protein
VDTAHNERTRFHAVIVFAASLPEQRHSFLAWVGLCCIYAFETFWQINTVLLDLSLLIVVREMRVKENHLEKDRNGELNCSSTFLVSTEQM